MYVKLCSVCGFALFFNVKAIDNCKVPYCSWSTSLPGVFCGQSYLLVNKVKCSLCVQQIFCIVYGQGTCAVCTRMFAFIWNCCLSPCLLGSMRTHAAVLCPCRQALTFLFFL